MAEVSELFLLPFDESEDYGDETLENPSAVSVSAFDAGDLFDSCGDSDSGSDFLDSPAGLALDLFDRRHINPLHADFRVLDGVEDMGSEYLGIGIGNGIGREEEGSGDVFFSGNRNFGGEGLRIVGFGSESDSEDEDIADARGESDLGLPLCWDCLHIDEEEGREVDGEFEWEEVDGRLDEREVLSTMVGEGGDGSDGGGAFDHDGVDLEVEDGEEEELGRIVEEWEVLLAVNNMVRNTLETGDTFYAGNEHEVFINASEYEILIGQFVDQDTAIRGSPPAAELVVKNLPSIVLTEDDVAKNNTLCAVCKDEIFIGESAKQLPCLHHYHGDCILPWLGIRNTCPVCRYELPTDDVDYESQRAQRQTTEELPIRYDFEMFPEL